MYRVGTGYDLHRLVSGRPLIVGGVEIPYHQGLDGYSDADVLTHALMDALLGAAGLKDIGHYFPPGVPDYKNISSLFLLDQVRVYLDQAGYRLVNVDSVIIAQAPKFAPYIEEMKTNIAAVLCTLPESVSIKATTTEGLGVCGRGEAIAAQAAVLLTRSIS
ncbi:MAG: 2-C-methyl-D-erythritol 2,4-cyclodiphosphate synthase [Dethiobacter sp.]|jgi:2-C-methyl-D-erythritol 2,4-cyclodiphosphate synthase|nr:2-C-methyl-D-erythritol 2,4-cyclodiphosphate synthase [Dethiobacter sp.]